MANNKTSNDSSDSGDSAETPTPRQIDLAEKIKDAGGNVTFGGETGDKAISKAKRAARRGGGLNKPKLNLPKSKSVFNPIAANIKAERQNQVKKITERKQTQSGRGGFTNAFGGSGFVEPVKERSFFKKTKDFATERVGKPLISGFFQNQRPQTEPQLTPSGRATVEASARAAGSILSIPASAAGSGRLAGLIGRFGGKASKAAKAGKAVLQTTKAAKTAKRAAQTLRVTKTGKVVGAAVKNVNIGRKFVDNTGVLSFPKDVVKTTAVGVATTKGAGFIGEATAPKEQKAAKKQKGFTKAFEKAQKAEKQKVSKQSFIKQAAFNIPGVNFFVGDAKLFEGTLRQELRKQGLRGRELEAAVNAGVRDRGVNAIAESAGLLGISKTAEKIGRQNIARVFKSQRGKKIAKDAITGNLFKKTFFPIAKAGVAEGVAGEVTQQQIRNEDLNIAKIGIFGAAGGLSAGLIGGGIAALRPTKIKTSKAIEFGANVLDPFEKPGDLLQSASERITGRIPVPTLTPGENFFTVGTTTQTKTKTKTKRKSKTKTKTRTPTQINLEAIVGTFNPTPTPTTPGTPTPTIPVNPLIDIPTNTDTPVPTNPFIPEQTQAPTQTPVQTPTNTFLPSINIPTVTPLPRLPPPVPLQFGAGSGGGGTTVGKGSKFLNELEISKNLFGELTGGIFNAPKKKKKRKKKKSKRRKRRKNDIDMVRDLIGL